MANELEWVYGSEVTLEANGGSLADNIFSRADDSSLDATEGGIEYPFADFVLSCSYTTAPAANQVINLFLRPLNIDGTNDAPAPDTTFRRTFRGSWVVNPATSAQYLILENIPIFAEQDVYIENTTGQPLDSGWTLKATRKTYAPQS